MAAPLAAAAKLLVKPILNALKKAAVKKAAGTTAAKAAGLTLRDIEKLSNLDVLNLVRAKAVKGVKKDVAKSIGITVKDLNEVLKDIKLTEARKNAVKGQNYVKNANRFLKDPIKTISGDAKRKIATEIEKEFKKNFLDEMFEPRKDEDESPSMIELRILQRELFAHTETLKLRPQIWAMADNLDVDKIRSISEKVRKDMYYTWHGIEFMVESPEEGGKGGGYKNATLIDIYLSEIHNLIMDGYTITKHNGGIL